MLTLHKLSGAVHRLQTKHISKAKVRRFKLGIAQFSLSEFTSLNAAGRKLGLNRFTGENRIRRTVTDTKLTDQLQQLLITEALAGRKGYYYCSLDHSQFGPFCIAVLAISIRKGRAIPVWCQVNVSEAALIGPLLTALTGLLTVLKDIAPSLS